MRPEASAPSEIMRSLITLTTDFGLSEPYVGAMKGAILSINREVDIVDVTHQVQSYDIMEAALALRCAYGLFPPGSIHLAVVDPGVGSSRRGIVVRTANYWFVGPDNGVFSLIYNRETVERSVAITCGDFFRHPVSDTFHGRDIFAPVAAWISRGVEIDRFGDPIYEYVRTTPAPMLVSEAGVVRGTVLHIDKFGNLITNLTAEELLRLGQVREFIVAGKTIDRLARNYSQGNPGELFALIGSAGFYEISTTQGSAAELLKARKGDEIAAHLV